MLIDCYRNSLTYTTDNNYEYRWESLSIPPYATSFKFKVKAASDVHIGLSAANMNLSNFYEIGEYYLSL